MVELAEVLLFISVVLLFISVVLLFISVVLLFISDVLLFISLVELDWLILVVTAVLVAGVGIELVMDEELTTPFVVDGIVIVVLQNVLYVR